MKEISHVYKKIGRTKWQPTPGFLSRESRGQRSLVGCCPWGRTESDMTEATLHACIGEGNGNPLQCFCLENPRERGTWWAAICGVTQSWTRLSNLTFTFRFHALVKEMATHASVLAWRIPGTREPGELPFMGSHRVRHD